jgi:hypothetical protein
MNVIEYFSKRNDVTWVEERQPIHITTKYAIGIVQSDEPELNILHLANLTGEGQIIGVADTGIDSTSCFFKDSTEDFPYDTTNYNHRKVVSYITYIDATDFTGHGTATSGIAAGQCAVEDGFSDYNGAAYNAKIAFFDIEDDAGALSAPSNANTALYGKLYTIGARVQSMSWGGTSNSYNADSKFVDQFMYNYKDAIVLFAVGNCGIEAEDCPTYGANSAAAPATCKSCLAVGASLNDVKSWNSFGTSGSEFTKDGLAGFSSRGPASDNRIKPEVVAAGIYIYIYIYCV